MYVVGLDDEGRELWRKPVALNTWTEVEVGDAKTVQAIVTDHYDGALDLGTVSVDVRDGVALARHSRDFGGEHVTEDDIRAWRQENPA